MELRRRRRREVRIDLSALIDAVFLLLIFFAVSTTFLDTTGLDLELPEAETGTAQDATELTVWIDREGSLRFRDEPVELGALEARIRRALEEEDPDRYVVLRADRHTPLETVVDVMDVARKSGARGVTIASRSE
ncbi:MAG: biopolymer transporter ExbD [Acidobacteriota bacterium]